MCSLSKTNIHVMLRHDVFHQQLDHRLKGGSHSGLAELMSQISRGALLDTRFASS